MLSGQLEFKLVPRMPNMDYDQCMSIQSPATDQPVITGQYCAISLDNVFPNDLINEANLFNDSLSKMFVNKMNNMSVASKWLKNKDIMAMFVVMLTSNVFKEIDAGGQWMNSFGLSAPISICIPRTCSTTDIEQVVNNGKINLLIQLN